MHIVYTIINSFIDKRNRYVDEYRNIDEYVIPGYAIPDRILNWLRLQRLRPVRRLLY